jgi:hypothetical protein
MKHTSIESYHSELESGRITKKQQEVLTKMSWLGVPTTAREVTLLVAGAWKRLGELERMGCVKVVGQVKCPSTNKMVSVYVPTGQEPMLKLTKDKRPKLKELEYEVQRLKSILDGYAEKMSNLYDIAYLKGREDEANGKETTE